MATTYLLIFMCGLFWQFSHPLSLGAVVLVSSLLAALSLLMAISSVWFSFLLAMVYISGMMIAFIYLASLVPNESSGSASFFPLLIMLVILNLYSHKQDIVSKVNESINMVDANSVLMNLKIYSEVGIFTTVALTTYLLIVLFMSTGMVSKVKGGLRSKK